MLIEGGARTGHRTSGQRRLERFEFLEKSLGLLQIRLEIGLLRGIGGPHDLVFELLNLLWKSRELPFDVRDTAYTDLWVGQVLLGALGDDDFQIGRGLGIDLVALPMIPMKMGIDQLVDRGLGQFPDVLVERPGRGRLGVRINHDYPIVGQNHCRVRIHFVLGRRNRGIYTVRHRFEFKEILGNCLAVSRENTAGVALYPMCAHQRASSRCMMIWSLCASITVRSQNASNLRSQAYAPSVQ